MIMDFRGRAKQILDFSEVELVNRKLDRINREIKSGKRKLLNSEQALGAYAKCLK